MGAVALVLTLAGCADGRPAPDQGDAAPTSATSASAPPDTSAPPVASDPPRRIVPTGTPTDVVTDLEAPWSIVFVGDSALVSLRDSARIVEVTPDRSVREMATIDGVVHGGEGGLLGLAIGPSGDLYAYSTGADGNRVQAFSVTGDTGSLALGRPRTIIDRLPSASNHNGGRIAFGPDGKLYVTVGDAGERDRARDGEFLGGKILRLEPDGTVPADNPTAGSPVFSRGHRNPQGIAWTADGRMIASEFGQNTWDELNVIVAGGDYGWPEHEGADGGAGVIDPVLQWATADASPSGIAAIDSTVFIANLRGRVLRTVPVDMPTQETAQFAGEHGRLRDVAVAPDGSLWVLTNNTDGRGEATAGDDRILRIEVGAR